MKSILVTGLCTLHWGRLQYGNIGNYYIIEPLFQCLRKYFANYEIITTFQMDKTFTDRENVRILPLELYYAWNQKDDLKNAMRDVEIAKKYMKKEKIISSPYIDALMECEYVVNVSGDMWGDNAEAVGHQRLLVDCLKMKTAQILKKKTILYAVTPGPFSNVEQQELVKDVFESYNLVVIREKISMRNLRNWGFSTDNVIWAPCPSFLFTANNGYQSYWTEWIEESKRKGRKVIGITFGGFNMPCGPYDMWPRPDEQYDVFVELAEYIVNGIMADIVVFSHTNGFELPPNFKLKNGRDFFILEQFYKILMRKKLWYKQHIILIDEPLMPGDVKQVINQFDMLITGRVHASVASTSQCIPTVFIEYERNVIYSDKMTGFSEQLGMEEYVCVPSDLNMLKIKVKECFDKLPEIRMQLAERVGAIKERADQVFEEFKKV